jgi:hypothetical protein
MKEHHPPARMKSRKSRSNAQVVANVLHESRALDDITERDMIPIDVYFQVAISNGAAHTITGITSRGSIN